MVTRTILDAATESINRIDRAEVRLRLDDFIDAAAILKEEFWKAYYRLEAAKKIIYWARQATTAITADEAQKRVGVPGSPDPIWELKAALKRYDQIHDDVEGIKRFL